tara:strand:+ start:2245 stop:2361 length:117 start_codon:yes stop_codon:yes gene_type:complete
MDKERIDRIIKGLKNLKKEMVFRPKIDVGNDDDCGGEN